MFLGSEFQNDQLNTVKAVRGLKFLQQLRVHKPWEAAAKLGGQHL